MGCYNTQGFVSRLPIFGGQRVVCFIATEYKDAMGHDLYDPSALVSPYFLPIHGEYDEYGSVENIEPTIITGLLEKISGEKIESLIKKISRGQSEVGSKINLPLEEWITSRPEKEFVLLFEHEDFYNKLTIKPFKWRGFLKEGDTFEKLYELINDYLRLRKEVEDKGYKTPPLPFDLTNRYIADFAMVSYNEEDMGHDLYEKLSSMYKRGVKERIYPFFCNDYDILGFFDGLSIEDTLEVLLKEKEELKKFLTLYRIYCQIPDFFSFSKTSGEQNYNLEVAKVLHEVRGEKLSQLMSWDKSENWGEED